MLQVTGLSKSFPPAHRGAPPVTALDSIDLTVPTGIFASVLGPSGSGKTTLLRCIAGFEVPDAGVIVLGGTELSGPGVQFPTHRRGVGIVPQEGALFPHLTVAQNVGFGLVGTRRTGRRERVEELLALVGIAGLADRRPDQLSGGQQQRVALARAIVNRPGVLLLDEPLGALDLKLRRQMQVELKRIQTEVGLTFVHVTHDQEEAMTMADTIAVMNAGRIEQMGAPVELYEAPRTTFVANFLGQSNMVDCTITSTAGDRLIADMHGTSVAMLTARSTVTSGKLLLGIRPEKLHVITDEVPAGDLDVVKGGVITDSSFIGVSTQYLVRMPWGQELMVFHQNRDTARVLAPGTPVTLAWSPEHAFGLSAEQDAHAGVETVDEAAS